ncbi:putative RNA methyltransferase [Arthrobacter sp. NPDC090010]|uniref:putative RNA methyltransferase n=1 Tax=Arthrobacter sp. NPDC090010 TaxID=3363942 RepID=UPI0038256533
MRDAVRSRLRCPHCAEAFLPGLVGRLQCPRGHSFDAARQGYFNFLTGKGTGFTADSAAMATARSAFLEAGHYAPLADAMAAQLASRLRTPRTETALLDAGAGTGYYLHHLLDALSEDGSAPAAVAFDISKFALRRAARLNPEAAVFVWDVWKEFPLRSSSIDAVTVVFAPRNPAEFHRVLAADGVLLVVTPQPSHLREIADSSGLLDIEEGKLDRLDQAMDPFFSLEDRQELSFVMRLSPAAIAAVARMGPAGHHDTVEEPGSGDDEALSVLPVTASFTISLFRPRSLRTERD